MVIRIHKWLIEIRFVMLPKNIRCLFGSENGVVLWLEWRVHWIPLKTFTDKYLRYIPLTNSVFLRNLCIYVSHASKPFTYFGPHSGKWRRRARRENSGIIFRGIEFHNILVIIYGINKINEHALTSVVPFCATTQFASTRKQRIFNFIDKILNGKNHHECLQCANIG